MRNWQIHFPFSRTNDSSSDIVSYFSFTPQSLKSLFFRLTLTTATPAIGIIATNLEQNVFLFLFSALCSQILSKVAFFQFLWFQKMIFYQLLVYPAWMNELIFGKYLVVKWKISLQKYKYVGLHFAAAPAVALDYNLKKL